MSSSKTELLNRQQLVSLIDKKSIKHAWLAQSIQVTEKTLTRWINGDVTRVRQGNLRKLAQALNCDVKTLIASSETEQYPSEKSRAVLVNELYTDSLLYELIIGNKVKLAIALIKSTFHSMLPSAIAASFYTKLGYAALIHRKHKTAKKHFNKAAAKSNIALLPEVQFSVNLAFAILYFMECDYCRCLEYLERCDGLKAHAGQELAHFYNTYALYHLYKANFERSFSYAQQCIDACGPNSPSIEKQLFLCTALQLQGAASIFMQRASDGQKLCEQSLNVALKTGYPRCIRTSQAYLSAVLAFNGEHNAAQSLVERYLNGAERDDISMPTLLCAAMYVYAKHNCLNEMQKCFAELETICPGNSAPLTFAHVLLLKTESLSQQESSKMRDRVDASLKTLQLMQWQTLIG